MPDQLDKCVLVTGAAGFVGHRTAQLFLESGYNVVGIDNLNDYYSVELKQYRVDQLQRFSGFSFHQIDIENKSQLKPLFERHQFEAIVNLAARAGVRYSIENPTVYLSTNAQGTLNLLDLMTGTQCKKFLLASTSSLYAGQEMPFREDLAVNTPISPYAASKKAAEALCYSYHYLYGIDVSIVRYFTVYGPMGRPDMSIFRFVKWIDEGTPITLYGDGEQTRDFTYVSDIAQGTFLAATRETGHEIINLGGGKGPISLNHIISLIESLLGKKAQFKYLPFHKADLKSTQANIDKAKALLEWSPRVGIEEGIQKTVEWYQKNIELCSQIPVDGTGV